jgi:hypothetical protein
MFTPSHLHCLLLPKCKGTSSFTVFEIDKNWERRTLFLSVFKIDKKSEQTSKSAIHRLNSILSPLWQPLHSSIPLHTPPENRR